MSDDRLPGCVTLGLALVIAFVALASLSGCGSSPIRQATIGIDIVADLTAGGAIEVGHMAKADRDTHCPHTMVVTPEGSVEGPRDPACLDVVRSRWAPADSAIDGVHDGLTAAVDLLDLARDAGRDPGAAVLAAVRVLHDAYDHAVEILASLGVTLPPWPPEAESVIALLVGLMGATS